MRLQKEGGKTYYWINWVNFMIKISGVRDRTVPSCLSRDLQKYIITSYNMLQREVWKSVWMHINTRKQCSGFEMQRSSLPSFPPCDLKGRKRSRNRDDKLKNKGKNQTTATNKNQTSKPRQEQCTEWFRWLLSHRCRGLCSPRVALCQVLEDGTVITGVSTGLEKRARAHPEKDLFQ